MELKTKRGDAPHGSTSSISGEGFVDIIEQQKKQYDTWFALKLWRPTPVLCPETTKAIAGKILQTPRMKDTIHQLVATGQGTITEITTEAEKILKEMGHTFNLKTVRMIGFFLAKLLRQLYLGCLVNHSGILKLSNAMSQGPVLLLPTHRSYADFLLISYLCYSLNIPLPVIAAGMDFKGMQIINKMLQNAGAFYIRRSFGNDLLYWSAVSEYMRHHVLNFQAPIEFFLEGTRSRNGKSLPPKIGLLTMALEPYLKGDVPDISLCTISISYERTLEENLYAYEVLGIPKPRESTTGFLSAVDRIRGQNYGRIYANISEPISVRDHLTKRASPDWGLPSYRFNLNDTEKKDIQSFAWDLVRRQQRDSITPLSAVIAALLCWRQHLDLQQLTEHVRMFDEVLAVYGTPCLMQGEISRFIKECLEVHKLVFHCDSHGRYYYEATLPESADLQSRAAARLALQSYSNQLLGPLINIAMYGYIRHKIPHCDDICKESAFFSKYFMDEFVLIKSLIKQDVTDFSALHPTVVNIVFPLVEPYVESFYIILFVLDMGFTAVKEVQSQYRDVATHLLTEGASSLTEILAVDKVPRHLHNLVFNGNLQQVKNNGQTSYHVVDISPVIEKLGSLVSQRFKDSLTGYREQSVRIKSQL